MKATLGFALSVLTALLVLAPGVAAPSDDLTLLALDGAKAIKAGSYDDALTSLNLALKKYPKAPDLDLIYWLSCKAQSGKRNYATAVTYCSAAILRNTKNGNFFADRGNAFFQLGDRANARRDLDTALAKGANKAFVHGLRARLFWEEGETVKAKSECAAALKLNPHEENARQVLAALRQGQKAPSAVAPPSVSPQPRSAPPLVASIAPADIPAVLPRVKPQAPAAAQPVAVATVLDCAAARLPAERMICTDANLRRQETDLEGLFRRAVALAASEDAMESAQRDWVALSRNVCRDRVCLKASFSDRRAELMLWIGD
jgi:Flp pilus assembly protein TadD